jgi:hypothetical protein
MRFLMTAIAVGALLLLTDIGSVTAETRAECTVKCAGDKVSRDMKCPSTPDVARLQCQQYSTNDYQSCLKSCPPPPTAAPKPSPSPSPSPR